MVGLLMLGCFWRSVCESIAKIIDPVSLMFQRISLFDLSITVPASFGAANLSLITVYTDSFTSVSIDEVNNNPTGKISI
jgi:hypothetical protein